jgi:hypothetical protein
MNNGITFKFNFETDNPAVIHELMPGVMEKIKALHQNDASYKSIELSLLKPGHDKATACLTIHTHDSVTREESREEHWEHAIELVFSQAHASHEHSIKLG